ncbi:MAG: energy-coupling factor transporter transmembrane protein EcfT [Methanimicrococcus sp.]|nr:energy-coupling factor transporter transmembrane protein EcfT [Methanimicrococcus sp.]
MNKKPLSYVDGSSFFHKADPRVKIVSLMVLSLLIFQTHYIWNLFFILFLFVGIAAFCRISLRRCLFAVRPLLFFVGILFVFQFLFTPAIIFSDVAGTVDSVLDHLPYESDGIKKPNLLPWDFLSLSPNIYSFVSAIGLALKFILLILFSSLMILTTKQSALIQGIEKMVKPLPLKWIHLTSNDVALMALLMIQFIPLLLSASSQVIDSARSRAFVFSKHPIKGTSLIAVCLIRSVMNFSDVVSMAMKNRGYTGVGRTHLHELKIQKRDIVFFGCFLFVISFVYVIAVYLNATVFTI